MKLISDIVLVSLLKNKKFARKTLPHIQPDYFESLEKKHLFNLIKSYVIEYKNLPTANALKLELTKDDKISESLFDGVIENIDTVVCDETDYDYEWLLHNCELWCKDRALHNAIIQSVEIIEGKKATTAIPEIVRKALQVEFETSIGIDFFAEKGIDDRWEKYQQKDVKFSTGIASLDNVFAGGVETKALSVLMAGSHLGKTSNLIALGANFLRNGYDVLYITLEMAEEKIAQRFDANFLDIDINDVPLMKQKNFNSNINRIKKKTEGNLVVKEFPPATIGTSKIRFLIDELKIKLGFEPKIIIVDYLNLMLSDRFSSDNSYTIVKSITEELRGLAVEKEYSILTATQGNRQTNDENNSDIDMTNVSESLGTIQTADTVVGLVMPTELREQNIQIWKILKNRFGGIVNHRIPLKVNFARAGLYEMENSDFNISGNDSSNDIKMKTEQHRLEKKNQINVDDDLDEIQDDFLDMMGDK